MITKFGKGIVDWGKKVGPQIGSALKETPASRAIHEMGAMQVREVGKKFTTKTGIGITAGVAGGTVGYQAGKRKKKRYS